MSENRPYTFELAAIALKEDDGQPPPTTDLVELARRNGVDPTRLRCATAILRNLQGAGYNIADHLRREYLIDGWLSGYLPLDADPADHSLTTWKLSQLAEQHHNQ